MIIRLDAPSGRRFEAFFGIYAASLPVREQKTRAEIESLIDRDDCQILVLEEDDTVLAFSIVYRSPGAGVALLEYMATEQSRRNGGLGAAMFEASLSAASGSPLLIEVDSEREDSEDRDLRRRRKAFYRRLGSLQIQGLAYQLPLPGEGAPPLMDLLVHPNGAALTTVPVERLRVWLEAVFADVYGQSPDDPRIAQMLSPLENVATLI